MWCILGVSNKIKALLQISGKSYNGLASYLGLASTQALYNKMNRDSWSSTDLIKVAEYIEWELIFRSKDGQTQTVALTVDDMKPQKKEN